MLLFMFKNRTICTDSDDIFRFLVYIYILHLADEKDVAGV